MKVRTATIAVLCAIAWIPCVFSQSEESAPWYKLLPPAEELPEPFSNLREWPYVQPAAERGVSLEPGQRLSDPATGTFGPGATDQPVDPSTMLGPATMAAPGAQRTAVDATLDQEIELRPTARYIGLRDVLSLAVQSNTEIQVRARDVGLAHEEIAKAASVFDPTVYYNFNQQYGRQPSEFSTSRPTDDMPSSNAEFQILKKMPWGSHIEFSGYREYTNQSDNGSLLDRLHDGQIRLSITQPLLRGAGVWVNTSEILLARQARTISTLRFRRLTTNTLETAEVMYWEFHLRFANYKDQYRTFLTARKLSEFSKAQKTQGLISDLDYARARGELARRRVNLTAAENALTIADTQLKTLTNYNQSRNGPTENWAPLESPMIQDYRFHIEDEITRGFQNRSDFRAAVVDLRSSHVQIQVSKNRLLPVLNLEGGVASSALAGNRAGVTDSDGVPLISPYEGDIMDLFKHHFWRDGYVWNIGVIVQFPVGRRFDRAQLRQKYLSAEQAFERLVRAERSIIREVRAAIQIIETTRLKVRNATTHRVSAETIYTKTYEQLIHGFTDVKRVVDALEILGDARLLENQAMAEYLQALRDLERANGTYLANRGIVLEHLQPTPHWLIQDADPIDTRSTHPGKALPIAVIGTDNLPGGAPTRSSRSVQSVVPNHPTPDGSINWLRDALNSPETQPVRASRAN